MARQIDGMASEAGSGMTGERDTATALERAAAAFQADVVMPLLAASLNQPDDVKALIESFRERLEALDLLLHAPHAPLTSANGTRTPPGDGLPSRPAPAARDDDIGRNQRSRVREMTLLDILAAEARPFSLPQVLRALEDRGFSDGQAAIVSQLHRMKKVGLIDQPANGMYEVREQGLFHLRKLKSKFGALSRG